MSELVYYVASSLDGFIAHVNGAIDGFEWDDEVVSDFFEDQKKFGTVLMGRKTYDVGLKEGKTSPYPDMHQIVFSKTMKESPDAAVELVNSDPVSYVKKLKSEKEKPIWICGGSDIATQLVKAKLIDKIVIKLNPVVFGAGIPLFGSVPKHISLELIDQKRYGCGIVFNSYDVV
ncbi:dihydrofolate reductase family protein [Parahaliea mediterranea]|uniref:Dihydrofolate reductase n=1 Tax=Parahaliea mediterranea TaxID=651086 RepID=A0A939DIZ8_9GAMM|nr:dihydrofolate reductase family protein [Parahaliea mediterranea]MBN7799189.1 dihydrofolate reductase [Parahaliea mediterranea]